ncbi:MAG: 4-hydroxyacetophenone monooxygenase [Salinisphaeraceae bacterium]|jgi:cation diffusion facilitator CzcD-associated flavoprotein CzcO|nr:4-hydroxyacetophenone monooxygenase [Salinisphaeraceae bacterium]
MTEPKTQPTDAQPRVAIVGSGFSGLCMAIRLKQAGFEDFVLLEKGDEVGGVWRENTYPGAACDVPWHLYSFSFANLGGFSCPYPEQPEIQAYQKRCAEHFALYPHIRFDSFVAGAHYDEQRHQWQVNVNGAEESFDVLVTAVGQLSRPGWPKIPGEEDFEGHSFHSAEWDHDHDLNGRRVLVIGTGASAIQFVPEVAKQARHLTVFQRSAPYLLPRFQRQYGPINRWLFKTFPGYRDIFRFLLRWVGDASVPAFNAQSRLSKVFQWVTRWHRNRQVKDPALREKLTPDYVIGCKRILFSSNYYPALTRENVELVTSPIERITADGVVTEDGREHAADTLIYGTGFKATEFLAPMDIYGLGGRLLADRWQHGAEAFKGITVDGFPNLFMCYGPNTNLGGNSIIYMIECQTHYILEAVKALSQPGRESLAVKPEVVADYNRKLQHELEGTVWNWGCSSWYHTADGRITNNWPGTNIRYKRETSELDLSNYEVGA